MEGAEPQPKRLRFRDENGREYDVEQILGLPSHVAINVLLQVDNVFTLYNFANVSRATREFMNEHNVFERWDERYFGPSRDIRTRAMNMLSPPGDTRRVTIFQSPTGERIQFALMFTSMGAMRAYIEGGEKIPRASVQYDVAGEVLPDNFKRNVLRGTKITEDYESELIGEVYHEITLARLLYRLVEFMDQSGYTLKTPEHNTPYNTLAFHMCLQACFDPRSEIRVQKGVKRTTTLQNIYENLPRNIETVQKYLEAGHRVFLKQPKRLEAPGVKFLNCLVCDGNDRELTHKCNKCQEPIHEACWVSSRHEDVC